MDVPPTVRPPRGYCWLPTMRLEPGMVIARPVFGGSGINAAIHLPIGTVVTASTIAQLINKGVEAIAVEQAPQDEEVHAAQVDLYEARLHEIFGPMPDEHCRPLLEALLADGPCQC